MHISTLEAMIRKIIKTCDIEKDNFGQIVIYTNLIENDDGTLREATPEDLGS